MISNCGSDENKKLRNGAAGDQTEKEWALINWYNRPWNCVLRHPDAKVRSKIAEMATAAAKNNAIGYDQNQRVTFWEQLEKNDYNPAKIKKKCEADCSSGVAAIVKAVGYILAMTKLKNVNIHCYTGNLRAALKTAGFEVLTDNKYLTSDAYLIEGDILLNDACHTAINVTRGSKASSGTTSNKTTTNKTETEEKTKNKTVKVDAAKGRDNNLAGTYKVTASELNLRAGAGTNKTILAEMPNGAKVQCYGYYTSVSGTKWLYVVYNGITGFASSEYLKK